MNPKCKQLMTFWWLFGLLIHPALNRAYAQTNAEVALFVLTSSENTYEVLRLSGDQITPIFSTPRISTETFATLASTEEMQAAQNFIATSNTGLDFKTFSTTKLDVAIQSFSVAPNHQDIIVDVLYQKCMRYPRYTCFGITRLILVSSVNKTTTVIWSIGLHSTQYVPQNCKGIAAEDVSIYDLRWTVDNQAVVLSISGDKFCFGSGANLPLIAISVRNQNSVFILGEAIAWNLGSDGRSLKMVTRKCSLSFECSDSLDTVQFDLSTRQISRRSYPFDQNRQFVPPSIVSINGTIVVYTVNKADQATPIDFSLFRENRQPNFTYSQPTLYGKIIASPDGQSAVIEDATGILSKIDVVADEIRVIPFLQKAVDYWEWGATNSLVIRYKGTSDYTIVDKQGNTIQTINIAKDVAALKQGINIESVKQ